MRARLPCSFGFMLEKCNYTLCEMNITGQESGIRLRLGQDRFLTKTTEKACFFARDISHNHFLHHFMMTTLVRLNMVSVGHFVQSN